MQRARGGSRGLVCVVQVPVVFVLPGAAWGYNGVLCHNCDVKLDGGIG